MCRRDSALRHMELYVVQEPGQIQLCTTPSKEGRKILHRNSGDAFEIHLFAKGAVHVNNLP